MFIFSFYVIMMGITMGIIFAGDPSSKDGEAPLIVFGACLLAWPVVLSAYLTYALISKGPNKIATFFNNRFEQKRELMKLKHEYQMKELSVANSLLKEDNGSVNLKVENKKKAEVVTG